MTSVDVGERLAELASRDLRLHHGDLWIDVHDRRVPMADQGWKLHIAARPATLGRTLDRALPVLLEHAPNFKVVRSVEHLRELNSPNNSSGSIGKAITVYPDQSVVAAIGATLADALRGLAAPVIISDRRVVSDAPVYYRYGPFRPQYRRTDNGDYELVVIGPEGEVFPGTAGFVFQCPAWATDPFTARSSGDLIACHSTPAANTPPPATSGAAEQQAGGQRSDSEPARSGRPFPGEPGSGSADSGSLPSGYRCPESAGSKLLLSGASDSGVSARRTPDTTTHGASARTRDAAMGAMSQAPVGADAKAVLRTERGRATGTVAGSRPGPLLGGRYRVDEGISRSARGSVYRATDLRTGREVVIKQARAYIGEDEEGRDVRAHLRNELRILHVMNGAPGFPQAVDHFRHGEDEYLVVTSAGGRDLRQDVVDHGRYGIGEPRDFGALARRLAALLDVLHGRGVVHRDLAPKNVAIDTAGRCLLIDFDISSHAGSQPFGWTPGYSPPEQRRDAPATPADDHYALGATLFYAVTGIEPIRMHDEQERNARATLMTLGATPALDDRAADIIPKLLSEDVADRAAAMESLRRPPGAKGIVSLAGSSCNPGNRAVPGREIGHETGAGTRPGTGTGTRDRAAGRTWEGEDDARKGERKARAGNVGVWRSPSKASRSKALGQVAGDSGGLPSLPKVPDLHGMVEHVLDQVIAQARETLDGIGERPVPINAHIGTAGIGLELLHHAAVPDARKLATELAERTARETRRGDLGHGLLFGGAGALVFLAAADHVLDQGRGRAQDGRSEHRWARDRRSGNEQVGPGAGTVPAVGASAAEQGESGSETGSGRREGSGRGARAEGTPQVLGGQWGTVPQLPRACPGERDDLAQGVAGTGMGNLMLAVLRERQGRRACTEELVRAEECAEVLSVGHELRTADELPAPLPGSGVRADLGMAHGQAGIAVFTVTCARMGIAEPSEAERRVAVLLAEVPGLIAASEGAAAKPMAGSWCQGLAGIGAAMLAAWRWLDDDRYLEAACAAGRAALRVAPTMAVLSQCCGMAGVGELMIDLGLATRSQEYLDGAHQVLALMLARCGGTVERPVFPDHSLAAAAGQWGVGSAGTLTFLRRLRDEGGHRPWTIDWRPPPSAEEEAKR
ncbi:class III lanthionine synthetase LanKC N-terminal domain-containing protein [Actinomadura parmotrematis]|uniref:non-specific serine/threonine protein kinase n=1 Tax=Actinomadura parmotrematis TaxID=2864039 RepID=A0ABS7FZY4_9ACTN|nr:lanthionine synthetase LanC family protein [Actinomadura parmotrematis]MBW8486013.1 protein kinase [Actinomadura parmotrematis]